MSQTHHFMLGLLAQTSIHAGADSSKSVVDLPIQREGHSGLPCIFGSAVKGALRARAELHYDDQDDVVIQAFGAEFGNQTAQAGALGVGDARLLLMPIRSLTSQFKWVTCEAAIKRYMRDCQLLGIEVAEDLAEDLGVSNHQVLIHSEDDGKEEKQEYLFLEEYRFEEKKQNLFNVIDELGQLMNRSDVKLDLRKQLVIVSDDTFVYLSKHATPVNPHIAIHSATKTVRDGALWYEETLPPDSLLYVPIFVNKGRVNKEGAKSKSTKIIASEVHDLFKKENPWLQLGGNETVGMGWCAVAIHGGSSNG